VTVVATHAADNVCGAGVSHTLGTTDANGHLETALPYGHWSISVTGRTAASGSWPELVLDPTASSAPNLPVNVT